MRTVCVVDLQFGSTGKGLFCGYMALGMSPDTIVTAWGPNAGHTFIGADGLRHVNIALPSGIIARPKYVLLGPGSVIDPQLLQQEIAYYSKLLGADMPAIMIHPHAAVVTEECRERERQYGYKIGSTMKGVGEAVIAKIRRVDGAVACELMNGSPFLVSRNHYRDVLAASKDLLIEGCQGYSLGINTGLYPHVTSRDCTVQQMLVDCGIPMARVDAGIEVYGVARTFPIRVANRFDEKGKQIGTSGPCYSDQREIEWSSIGVKPELTTVTKLPRRIFTWSRQQISEAILMNGVDAVFLNFVNYLGDTDDKLGRFALDIQQAGSRIGWIGTGPTVNDIMEV